MFLCCMKTVKDVFAVYKAGMAGVYNPSEIEAITLLVLKELLDTTNAKLKAFPETEISYPHNGILENMLTELKTGKPVQYVLGHTEFYNLPFNVTSAVLIPRPETEELVQWMIDTAKQSAKTIHHVLDIGTGSGCIAISLKKHLPDIKVFAIDISTEALKIAAGNATSNSVDIDFIEADILNFDKTVELPKFDLIVSNPPYVTEADKLLMHKNVTGFEPHIALFVPEREPLLFYDAIADFALERLCDGGQLFFEINESLGKKTVALLKAKSFRDIELRKDMSGRDRMVRATPPKPPPEGRA